MTKRTNLIAAAVLTLTVMLSGGAFADDVFQQWVNKAPGTPHTTVFEAPARAQTARANDSVDRATRLQTSSDVDVQWLRQSASAAVQQSRIVVARPAAPPASEHAVLPTTVRDSATWDVSPLDQFMR